MLNRMLACSKMPSENAINCSVENYEGNRADNFEKTDHTRSERKKLSTILYVPPLPSEMLFQ